MSVLEGFGMAVEPVRRARIARPDAPSHMGAMQLDKQTGVPLTRRNRRSALIRSVLFWLGVVLVIASPLVGAIPGPGGVFVFAAGAGLMLKNSRWAKKKYAQFKKRHPNKGDWADWSLRRQSHFRRKERDKALAGDGEPGRNP
jgi:hypothetical protein